ncbi:MAG: TIGR04283 family arsenosugar biosynthesis glycosyltransferase [Gammaproteobacteria bacterium]
MESKAGQGLTLSVIIPVLNESTLIASTLANLEIQADESVEIIVVDGGSTDRSVELARQTSARVLVKVGGRAIQMNHGAKHARGCCLLFLHADTRLPLDGLKILQQCVARQCVWGRFDVRLSGRNPLFRLIESGINLRSRLTGMASGDQGIFVMRRVFEQIGGFPNIPLMEDIALSKRLKKISEPLCLRQKATTSSRRWERHGIVRTILLMWTLRVLFFSGVKPERLARWYQ